MRIPVLFEHDEFLVINKPSGMVVHPFDHSQEETLVDVLHEYCPALFTIEHSITLQDGRTIALGGIVHKLDRETSGVMVVAKTQPAYDELKKQFTEHTINKTYLAHVEGNVQKDLFVIDAPLGRNKKDYKQTVNPAHPRGELREAVTEVRVFKRMLDTTLVQLQPKTGRTHQLRAHMASIGHPIIGDRAYGSMIISPRILLHAQMLAFSLAGKEYRFEANIPEDFIL